MQRRAAHAAPGLPSRRAGTAAGRHLTRCGSAAAPTLPPMGTIEPFLRRAVSGFTLPELVVTLAVAGVLTAIAIPSFTSMLASNRLGTAANAAVAALGQARLEAVSRNGAVQFCGASGNGGDTLGSACSGTGAVYALDEDDEAVAIRAALGLPAGVRVVSATALRYNAQGIARSIGGAAPYTGLAADLVADDLEQSNHRCIYVTTGSVVSSCSYTNTSGNCPASEPNSCSP